jgi:hypothetical protein
MISRIIGALVVLAWVFVLAWLIGYKLGWYQRPEFSDPMIFAACCFGISAGWRGMRGE